MTWQERLNTALTNIGIPIAEEEITDDDDYPPELVNDDSSVESDSGTQTMNLQAHGAVMKKISKPPRT